jgi:hypothetical protein
MIVLKDLFTLLATGEFSNISLSRNNTGGINESEYAKVIGHINLGLVEIYKRFKLMENELTLHVTPDLSVYYLQDDRVVVTTPNTTEYLEFLSGQTGVNIIEITGVFDVDGNELVINNRHSTPSILQQSIDILKITKLTEAMALNIVYQAYPIKLVLDDDFDPETHILPISDVIVEALLYYIASRIYKPTGANNSTANADKSAGYQQQYELSCQKIDLLGLGIQNCDSENTFETRGWA